MRPSWDEYFMQIAAVVATRSTCRRKQVGSVLVLDRRIVSTGYGGSLPGQPHCTDECGCDIPEGQTGCRRTVHSEANSVIQAARHGISTVGTTCYCTLLPCRDCFKLLAAAGIVRIVYGEEYRIKDTIELAKEAGIECQHLPLSNVTVGDLVRDYSNLRINFDETQATNHKLLTLLNRILGDEGPDVDAYLDGHVEVPSVSFLNYVVRQTKSELAQAYRHITDLQALNNRQLEEIRNLKAG